MSQDNREEVQAVPVNTCFLCGKRSGNLTDNLGHMERQHSFFVPHKKAAHIQELMEYIGDKVGPGTSADSGLREQLVGPGTSADSGLTLAAYARTDAAYATVRPLAD